jgi:hypothetical protein
MTHRGRLMTIVAGLWFIGSACGSANNLSGSGGSASGGSNASGGSGGSGSGTGGSNATGGGSGSCSNVTACGGSVVGSWSVMSSCLSVSGNVDVSSLGVGCTSVSVTGSLSVTGSWTANANGTYTDNTTTTGTETVTVPAACLNISGTTTTCERIGGPLAALGFQDVTCTDASGGGCTCAATVQQSGGVGVVSFSAAPSGNYTTSGNKLTVDSVTNYSYCVSGSKMTWTPQTSGPSTSGTVVFQKGSSTGTGGVIGTGGSGTGGGATGGAGGAKATGGAGGGALGGKGGTSATGGNGAAGSSGTGGSSGSVQGPCDIYAAGSTPCVAAYSTTRLLNSKYTGFLYQVRKGGSKAGSGGTTMDIGTIAGGYADSAAQDALCSGSTCTISKLYDQSGKGNDLVVAPAGCYTGTASQPDNESDATKKSVTLNGHKVYALYMVPQDGYRNNKTSGMPTGNMAQGIYMVADGTRTGTTAGTACCWDFGNAKTNNCNGPTGSMDAMYFGTGYWGKGTGSGPWFMGDFEAGVWATGSGASSAVNSMLPSSNIPFAFGTLKTSTSGSSGQYAIRVGNGQSGSIMTAYDGQAPAAWQTSGAVILGIGGDNSNSSQGTLFEGAITAGRPSDSTDASVLMNVQAAGYGK